MAGNPDGFVKDPEVINGIPDFYSDLRTNIPPDKSAFISITKSNGVNHIRFDKFTQVLLLPLMFNLTMSTKVQLIL